MCKFAAEILSQCKYIHPSKLAHVEQLLQQLKDRLAAAAAAVGAVDAIPMPAGGVDAVRLLFAVCSVGFRRPLPLVLFSPPFAPVVRCRSDPRRSDALCYCTLRCVDNALSLNDNGWTAGQLVGGGGAGPGHGVGVDDARGGTARPDADAHFAESPPRAHTRAEARDSEVRYHHPPQPQPQSQPQALATEAQTQTHTQTQSELGSRCIGIGLLFPHCIWLVLLAMVACVCV